MHLVFGTGLSDRRVSVFFAVARRLRVICVFNARVRLADGFNHLTSAVWCAVQNDMHFPVRVGLNAGAGDGHEQGVGMVESGAEDQRLRHRVPLKIP